jgi:hypothetical protein
VNRLNTFLSKASLVCESILDELAQAKNENTYDRKESKPHRHHVFDPKVVTLGVKADKEEDAKHDKAMDMLSGRSTVSVSFSPLQPTILVTAHTSNQSSSGIEYVHVYIHT